MTKVVWFDLRLAESDPFFITVEEAFKQATEDIGIYAVETNRQTHIEKEYVSEMTQYENSESGAVGVGG